MSLHGINLATRALQAHQRSLEIAGQNIANVNTPGYSRQIGVLRPVPGLGEAGPDAGVLAPVGGGVDVARVVRAHAAWLDASAHALEARAGQTSIAHRFAMSLEGLSGEPGEAGLQAVLDRYFDAFDRLAVRPDDPAARDGVLRAGGEVASRFRELIGGIDALQEQAASLAAENVAAVNRLTARVASLNRSIGSAQAAGGAAAELLDERDQLLQELVRRTGASVSGQEEAQVVVSLAGHALVQGELSGRVELAGVPSSLRLDGEPVAAPGGELREALQWANALLPAYRDRVGALRDGFASAVNALHRTGRDATGAPGGEFFQLDAAGQMTVSPTLLADPRRVAAGGGAAADGSVARAIGGLRTGGAVLPPYRALVAELGASADQARRADAQAQAALGQIRSLQASETGVNLDEELAQTVTLQHAYAASARLLSTFDEMLVTLIERTGA